jgi:hypothetical protein
MQRLQSIARMSRGNHAWPRFLALAALVCLTSCAADPEPEQKPEPPRLVGRIASIVPAQRFVLIQSYGRWTIESGTILTTRGDDERSANLRVTGEQQGQFAAADIQSGEVRKGDAVYTRHTPKPVAAAEETQPDVNATETPATPADPPAEPPGSAGDTMPQ